MFTLLLIWSIFGMEKRVAGDLKRHDAYVTSF